MRLTLLATSALILLGACSATVQHTSGKDYLARTRVPPVKNETITTTHRAGNGATYSETVEVLSTDELVRRAAAVEPILTLPARIGLARIEHGQLTVIPAHEAGIWQSVAARFPGLGQTVPLDPFLAEYTSETVLPQDARKLRSDSNSIITRIRLGGARQHLDAVLIYEIGAGRSAGIRHLGAIRVLGAAGLDGAAAGRRGVARALLLDVRNGYPYATISSSADLDGAEPDFWASDADDKAYVEATRRIVRALSGELDKVFREVVRTAATRVAAK